MEFYLPQTRRRKDSYQRKWRKQIRWHFFSFPRILKIKGFKAFCFCFSPLSANKTQSLQSLFVCFKNQYVRLFILIVRLKPLRASLFSEVRLDEMTETACFQNIAIVIKISIFSRHRQDLIHQLKTSKIENKRNKE